MNVTVVLTDERTQYGIRAYDNPKSETYERVNLTLDGNAALIANALRAIADELAPVQPTPAEIADAMAKRTGPIHYCGEGCGHQ